MSLTDCSTESTSSEDISRKTAATRCGLYLESNQALQEHLRSIDICPIRKILPQMGFMNQTQWCEISKKRQIQMTPLQERWKEIYLILFPEVDESSIPGPCEYIHVYVEVFELLMMGSNPQTLRLPRFPMVCQIFSIRGNSRAS